jgi:valyl-tRNA synthetase
MLFCSPAGNDLLYDDSLPEQGRNFANKIWNAFRLVKGWNVDEKISQPESSKAAVKWMDEALKKATAEIDSNFRKFRISEALMVVYKLFWDEFSGWYLEAIKPEYEKPADKATYDATLSFFDRLMRLIHPFMPFISEDIWQMLSDRKEGESIMISKMPESKKYNKEIISLFETAKEIISSIRSVRKEKDIPGKENLNLFIKADEKTFNREFLPIVAKLCYLDSINFTLKKEEDAASFMVGTTEFFIPLKGKIDIEAELSRISEELKYYRGFLASVMKKLDNERFVQNAPANVLETERKKKSDAESKIKSLEERERELKKLPPSR